MRYKLKNRITEAHQIGEALWVCLWSSLLLFFTFVLVDTVSKFMIGSVTFYFSVFLLSSVLGSLLRVALALPSLFIIVFGAIARVSKLFQIVGSLFVAWAIAYSFDLFWSNIAEARLLGFDLVVDGELTLFGVLIGFIFASRDVFFAACAAYLVLWRQK